MRLRPLRRLALLLALAGTGQAAAECRGPSLLEGLDASRRAALDAQVAATPYGHGILWSATRGASRILLAGTMHLPDPRHGPILAALAPALREADLVLLEATPAEEEAMARAIEASPALALLPEGAGLPERLGPAAWAAVAEAASARGLAPEAAARFRPWLLSMILSAPPCATRGLGPGDLGLDRLIGREAEAAGVPLAALEPWDTLFRLFSDAGEAGELALLRLSLLPEAAAEGLLVAQSEGYFAGRTAEIWQVARLGGEIAEPADPGAWAGVEEALLARRNAAWVPVIEAAATENPRLLVAAGASHLPGEAGLLRLLEARGWRIAALPLEGCCQGAWAMP